MYTPPRIITLDSNLLPTPPEGWKYTNLIEPSGTTPDLKHYPVLLFGPYTYTGMLPQILNLLSAELRVYWYSSQRHQQYVWHVDRRLGHA